MSLHPEDVTVDGEEEFRQALAALLEGALHDGIDVERHWTCRTDGTGPDWEVDVVRLAELGTAEA